MTDRKIDISPYPKVKKTIKNLNKNVEFFATRFATYNKISQKLLGAKFNLNYIFVVKFLLY